MNLKKAISIIVVSLLYSGMLYSAVNPETIWRYPTGGKITTTPVEDSDGTIYFCSEDRFLYALNKDGTLKWRSNLQERLSDTLTLAYDGTIYAGSRRGSFFAVNPLGERLWKINLTGIPVGNPAAGPDGTLYIVTDKGWFYSVSHTGFIRWEIELPAIPILGPVIGTDIYLALNNERIYSYNNSGTRGWTFLLSGKAESLVLSLKNLYVGTDNSSLVSIDFSGSRIWNLTFPADVSSIIVLTDDRIVCSSGKHIIMLDSSGSYIWDKSERNVQIDLAAFTDRIISRDTEGTISWFDMDGTPLNQIKGTIPSGKMLVSSDGNIYVGSKDWLFYKYGFRNLISSNYVNYIWPSFGAGIENRSYLLTNKFDQNITEFTQTSDYVYFIEMAKSLNEKQLNILLDEIEKRIYSRRYDPGKAFFLDILEILASECVTRPLYEEGRLLNNFPVIRARAIDILGITGDFNSIKFISDLLVYEWDEYVINSIIRSLGNLQSDIDGIITAELLNFYNKYNKIDKVRSLSQILFTVQKMNKYSGVTNIRILGIITDIFFKSSSGSLKELALDTINTIKK